MKLKELQAKIIQWADDKGILEKATPEKQFLKFIEETGELAKAILKQDSEEFIDAIGDVFVTIVIHAELTKSNLVIADFLSAYYDNVDHILDMALMTNDMNHNLSLYHLKSLYKINQSLSNGKTFDQCVETAYNVIAGRTGEMVNGTFVKDEEWIGNRNT